MKAVVFDRFGGPEVLRIDEVPMPVPKADEVLVEVNASTVSMADHRLRGRIMPEGLGFLAGLAMGFRGPRNRVLGTEFAGIVASVGKDVTRFRIGDAVLATSINDLGGHAEYACIPEDGIITPMPANLSFEEAASLPFGGLTAFDCFDRAPIDPGARVLINGASGAVGTAAAQMAVAMGAEVTGVCSGRNADLVRDLGAAHVIDYTREDFACNGVVYDHIVDCVGNVPVARAVGSLRKGGALSLVVPSLATLVLGKFQGRRAGFQVNIIFYRGGARGLQFLVDLAEAGQLRPVIDRSFALEEVAEAHRLVASGRKRGNAILRVAAG